MTKKVFKHVNPKNGKPFCYINWFPGAILTTSTGRIRTYTTEQAATRVAREVGGHPERWDLKWVVLI